MTVAPTIDDAVAALRAGALVGLPTETVYGLAADASNAEAVRRVFAVKGRPASHPVIVHLADASAVPRWAREFPPAAQALAARFWPGPLTLVLPRAPGVLDEVTGGQDTVALRVPAHPVARRVLEAFGGGLAAPSANRYGRISPTTAAAVREELGDAVAVVLDGGACDIGLESTIVACLEGRVTVLRPGRITREEVAACVGDLDEATPARPRVPGSTRAHYAPSTPLRVVSSAELASTLDHLRTEEAAAVAVLAFEAAPPAHRGPWQVAAHDAATYGHQLYAHLRALDRAGAAWLVVEQPPEGPAWLAVHDRLRRAAAAHDDLAAAARAPRAHD